MREVKIVWKKHTIPDTRLPTSTIQTLWVDVHNSPYICKCEYLNELKDSERLCRSRYTNDSMNHARTGLSFQDQEEIRSFLHILSLFWMRQSEYFCQHFNTLPKRLLGLPCGISCRAPYGTYLNVSVVFTSQMVRNQERGTHKCVERAGWEHHMPWGLTHLLLPVPLCLTWFLGPILMSKHTHQNCKK